MLSQLGFEHDVACHRWEELFEDQAPAIVSARAPEPRPEPTPKPKLEPAPAAAAEVAAEVLARELAKLRRKNRIAITACILALLALPFACAL